MSQKLVTLYQTLHKKLKTKSNFDSLSLKKIHSSEWIFLCMH